MGAGVSGIDLGRATDEVIATVVELILVHKVLFFTDQHLCPEAQLAFARSLGEIATLSSGTPGQWQHIWYNI